jgi:hypothetical protein
MKYENLALEIKIISKLNNVSIYPLVISAEGVITRNLPNYLENMDFTKNTLRVGQQAVPLRKCHIVRKFLTTRPLTLRG